MDYQEQIERIKQKLRRAREADSWCKVFGASSHNYQTGAPAKECEVEEFEAKYNIKLPECYRAFILGIGNGGSSYRQPVAGPFYGIYPLGEGLDEIMDDPEEALPKPVSIHPEMSEEEWQAIAGDLLSDEDMADEEFDAQMQRVYGGILPLGSQGCTYLHGLLLNGEHAGKVVNLCLEREQPKFTYEANFLDWYERWLDEVIAGVLVGDSPAWFGYTKGGYAEQLVQDVRDAECDEKRVEALRGLLKWDRVSDEDYDYLFSLLDDSSLELRVVLLQVLSEFNYEAARETLLACMEGEDKMCLVACQCFFWYAKDQPRDWIAAVKKRLPAVNDPELFRFMGYLLGASETSYSEDLESFMHHEDKAIRSLVFYFLGNHPRKSSLVEWFKIGLNDPEAEVVHATLQALHGVNDPSLMEEYQKLKIRYKVDEYYIQSNLKLRMDELHSASPIKKLWQRVRSLRSD